MDFLSEAFHKGSAIDVIFTDFAKALDKVPVTTTQYLASSLIIFLIIFMLFIFIFVCFKFLALINVINHYTFLCGLTGINSYLIVI